VPDWLIALDDHFAHRLWHCTDCGDPTASAWTGIFNLRCGASVAYQMCERCKQRPGREEALRQRLEGRYSATQTGGAGRTSADVAHKPFDS
jgi:hypothetical protein